MLRQVRETVDDWLWNLSIPAVNDGLFAQEFRVLVWHLRESRQLLLLEIVESRLRGVGVTTPKRIHYGVTKLRFPDEFLIWGYTISATKVTPLYLKVLVYRYFNYPLLVPSSLVKFNKDLRTSTSVSRKDAWTLAIIAWTDCCSMCMASMCIFWNKVLPVFHFGI